MRRLVRRLSCAAWFAFAGLASAAEGGDPVVVVSALVDAGQFQAAEAQITDDLQQPGLDRATRGALAFQRERMRRILLDFSLSADQAKARLRKQIPDLGGAEFARWDAEGLLEHQAIDGRMRYFKRAPANLFRLSEQARARLSAPAPFNDSPLQVLNPYHRAARDQALAEQRSSVAPRRVRITQSLSVHAGAVPAGETVRAWLPYPRALPGQQEDIRFIDSVPSRPRIAPASALQRTVYLEQPARAGQPTHFEISYEVTVYGQYHAIDPAKVVPAAITAELAPYVAERAPHLLFTEQLRLFSRQIVGEETNPYRIAQKLYAAVDRMPWAGAREYSTIANLSDYSLHAGHGDCGEQTMLLIALLRLNGIPARWQSGWIFSDGRYNNMHDWGWLYLAPYGWVPMDVTFGRLDSSDPQLANFYLGGLDAYRVAFNDDYSRDLVPAKQFARSETVDLQRGEAEWRGGNLYFDQWDYDFAWRFLPVPGKHPD